MKSKAKARAKANRKTIVLPEAEDIKDWEWTVSAVSVYGKENEESNITFRGESCGQARISFKNRANV